MDWEVCSHLSGLLVEGHRLTCSQKPMGQLRKQNLRSGIPMSPLPKDYTGSWDVKIARSLSITVKSSADLWPSFIHQTLRLTKLSASGIPKIPTFSYHEQPPDRSRRSEAGQSSWGCSYTRAGSSPMLTAEDSLAGFVSEPHVFWLCWCLQPQSLPYTRDSCFRRLLSVPWEPQYVGTRAEPLIKYSQTIRSYPLF